ncbi:hypothetical protein GCM10010172_49100 [Paractinoplanes ferrugineus]|uniref:Lipoprotein n=1 Tax=Paractinoplanes ferrugineus TaxID=113564 RepID=A0A919J9B8_9ACTN|nr:hypothetical protein [Actinoplanes ferrugineus]GIE16145.1 hypothetical protein Afe05nite_79850 [Actinoplanes ferrugineus]
MRLGVVLGGVALVAAVGGCSARDDTPTWTAASPTASASAPSPVNADKAPAYAEPFQYSYTLTRGCDAKAPLGRYNIVVKSGDVIDSKRLGASVQASPSAQVDLGPAAGQDGEEIDPPTLAGLITMARTAEDDGAQVTATYDAKNGRPVKLEIKADDETECFAVSDYDIWHS